MPTDETSLIYGRHAVLDFIERHPGRMEKIWIRHNGNFSESIWKRIKEAKKAGAVVQRVDRQALDRMADGQLHQGIVARVAVCSVLQFKQWLTELDPTAEHSVVIVLDGVQDPRNLGAVFRSGAAASVDGILIARRGAAPFSATAMKASAGTLDCVPAVRVSNIRQALQMLQKSGYWVLGVTEKAEAALPQCKMSGRVVLVFGSEGKGIKPINLKSCDETVRIPMVGPAGSLNISSAVSIVLYEFIRQMETVSGLKNYCS